jgi:hypothetical protein
MKLLLFADLLFPLPLDVESLTEPDAAADALSPTVLV